MNAKKRLAIAVLLLLAPAGAAAEDVAGLPLHVEKLAPTAIRLWIGDFISSTATVAVATRQGILVIDTTGHPTVDRELRRIIARELGRSDFKYLVNTHEHGDHTGGNAAYADCTILGHELVAAGMAAQEADRARLIDWLSTRIAELERGQDSLAADPMAAKRRHEELTVARLGLETRQSGERAYPPTKTFADRMKLDMGDTTFELYYIGGMHSASDIAIFVPQCGLLMTGDTMADVWLTDTPGCLASFMARPGVRHDFPLLLENWGLLLKKEDAIRKLVPGHWNGELSFAGAAARVDYVHTLWEGVNQAAASGTIPAGLLRDYRLETRFPALAQSPGLSPTNNYTTILEMWSNVTKQESAADRLYTLIDAGAAESAVQEVVAARDVEPAKYFFLEDQINYAGYRFLQEEKVPQAIALFRVNMELYPGSWNTYDSLGEALLKSGDTEGAIAMYEKSVQLNPESKSGKEALARIRAARPSP